MLYIIISSSYCTYYVQIVKLSNKNFKNKLCLFQVKVMNLNVSESMFKKPLPLMLDNYFEYHPLQPVSHTFFNCKKVFYKADGTNRFWLTF